MEAAHRWLALLRLELRRSPARWPWVLLVALNGIAYLLFLFAPRSVALWAEASASAMELAYFGAPIAAGLACWAAHRSRRPSVEELLAGTPPAPLPRELVTLAATAIWASAAYLAAISVDLGWVASRATWGHLNPWPPLYGLLATLIATAFGFALGRALPGRSTAAFVAIAVFVGQFASGVTGTLAALGPVPFVDGSTWYEILPDVRLPRTVYRVGLLALGLAAVALTCRARRTAAALAVLALALALPSGAFLAANVPTFNDSLRPYPHLPEDLQSADFREHLALIPYEPVCEEGAVTVCVHPAYAARLPGVAATVNRIAAPLRGLPGVPTRAEQLPFGNIMPNPSGVVGLNLDLDLGERRERLSFLGQIAGRLIADGRGQTQVSQALAVWLLQTTGTVGGDATCEELVNPYGSARGGDPLRDHTREVCQAVAGFTALPAERQRSWVIEHLSAVRAQRPDFVDLADLPGG